MKAEEEGHMGSGERVYTRVRVKIGKIHAGSMENLTRKACEL